MIPLFDIKPKKSEIKQYLNLYKKNLLKADFIQGQQVKELEKALSNYTGIKYVQTCANGTDALFLALSALNLKKNNKKKYVITTPLSWISTSNAIINAGFTPLYVDINKYTFNLDHKLIQEALDKNIKKVFCVLSVDLFGCPNDNDKIYKICKTYKVPFIIDGAQSFGSKINNKSSFIFSDIATTSFFPTKPLSCFGDGGAVFTENKTIFKNIKSLSFNGKGKSNDNFISSGINSRLDTLQATILIKKLKNLNKDILKKKKIFHFYKKNLKKNFTIQQIDNNKSSAYALCTICIQSRLNRKKILNYLIKNKISSSVYYMKLLNEHHYIKNKSRTFKNLKNSYYLKNRIFSLPMHNSLTKFNLKKITFLLNQL